MTIEIYRMWSISGFLVNLRQIGRKLLPHTSEIVLEGISVEMCKIEHFTDGSAKYIMLGK